MATVQFTINGEQHAVSEAAGDGLSLAQYIREVALLTGTKVSCGEGGCGACIVTVVKGPTQPGRSVNSCLTPVNICHGWSITTIEGLGGKEVGYHPIQASLAAHGGSQCGYCSPGMVMQLHSLLQEQPSATQLQIDNILDGNICRCTGYRPILDAFKAFGSDAPKSRLAEVVGDIEELGGAGGAVCHRTGAPCPGAGRCAVAEPGCHTSPDTGSTTWYHPSTTAELAATLAGLAPSHKYRIVGGNTGTGVFKHEEEFYQAQIDINGIPELRATSLHPLTLGANVTITDAIRHLGRAGKKDQVWLAVSQHLSLIASVGIRNQGTLAGNLMLKHAHNDFPSDVFLSLETVGAMLEIVAWDGAVEEVTVGQFVTADMNRRFLKTIKFPTLEKRSVLPDLHKLWLSPRGHNTAGGAEWKVKTFKIMPRSSNAHAYVNAGFLALVDTQDNFKIQGQPTIVFGGINSTFQHARQTELFLIDRHMNDHSMFLEALTILAGELEPSDDPVLASPVYRKQLAMGLFYKFFLHVLGDAAPPAVRSGAGSLERGLSGGQQTYDTDPALYPVSEPREKVEARWQTAGEIKYTPDLPLSAGELHGAFVLSNRANCSVESVDPARALARPGVVNWVAAEDIPGVNNWKFTATAEEIFSSGQSNYAGQALGLLVAETREAALEAARHVSVVYGEGGSVVVDVEAALEDADRVVPGGYAMQYGDVAGALAGADRVVSGRFKMGSQYHFHMETQTCLVSPVEDGYDVAVASQDVNMIQAIVSLALAIPANSVNPKVTRLGGSYGGKIYLPNHLATAAAVAAHKLGRPVRVHLPLEDNMRMLGKRCAFVFDYKLGLDREGKILALESDLYSDGGWSVNDVDCFVAALFVRLTVSSFHTGTRCLNTLRQVPAIKLSPYGVRTDTAPTTATRAPGMVNGHAMIEAALQHAACEMGLAPLELRLANLMETGDPVMPPPFTLDVPSPIGDMIEQLQSSADYTTRQLAVADYNTKNRWKKRGLALVPMRFGHSLFLFPHLKYNCLISVFMDGSVSVAHNGIEMGQGINTKVAQVVAYELGIEVEDVKIKPVTATTNPNGATTGGSAGSECNCVAAIGACAVLKERLAPIRDSLGPAATWRQVITAANEADVDLCARYLFEAKKDNYLGYSVWGAAATEVELDIITGESRVVRVDLLEDAGLSTSPEVDIGQVEGAFCMGLGLWTSEEIKHDPETGELLTKNTWEYKPPAAKDIPEDFRVTLLRNSRNPLGVLGSKATGEPALLMAISVLFALRDALTSSRRDSGLQGWFQLNGPATVEHTHQHGGVTPDQFIF